MASIYDSSRLAAAYARSRPPVHAHIIAAAKAHLEAGGGPRASRALDIGCGAGLSTAALDAIASERVGVEPVKTMLRHHRIVAPGARFVVGRAEELPFRAASFDMASAAGALNYADADRALAEIARVLAPGGTLLIYDFSSGRELRDDRRLDDWFAAFLDRYPYPPGYALDVRAMPFAAAGLQLEGYDPLEVLVPMTGPEYLAYAMSETNVEQALRRGEAESAIREWCVAGLQDIFAPGPREVLFPAYVAYIRKM